MTHPAISRLEPWFSLGLEALTSNREVLRRGPPRSSPPLKGGAARRRCAAAWGAAKPPPKMISTISGY